jgi:uncharacterized protein (DUF58 family)
MRTSIVDVLARPRTPAEPGPGRLSWESLRALDLAIGRRVNGLLSGDYRSAFTGIGAEFQQVRPYAPGDDVRRIDWNVTARTGQVHVRVELAERELVTWLVLDLSRSMVFGTADRRKVDVAEGVAIAVGHAATRRGRLGVVWFGGRQPRFVRPRKGREALLTVLGSVDTTDAGSGALADALTLVSGVAHERSLIVVVSDFLGSIAWQQGLSRLAARHRILAVEIRDPREEELSDAGELWLEDWETGEQLLVDTSDLRVRAGFKQAADEERRRLAVAFVSSGVPHLELSTEGDWLKPLAAFLNRSDQR